MSLILDGRIVRDVIKAKLAAEILSLSSKPKLVISQIGDLGPTNAYIRQKKMFGGEVGAVVDHRRYPETVSEEELLQDIAAYNADESVHGVILQLPIPKTLDGHALIEAIHPHKDLDGLHSVNVKKLWENNLSGFTPATAKGGLSLLDHYKITLSGKRVVVVGRSSLVGRPVALSMLHRDATVTICHKHTENLAEETRRADVLIVAAGHPQLITAEHVVPGQTVVDVGINVVGGEKLDEEITGTKLVGDVDFENVKNIVAAISPVPGGVGPMTVASLFENLLIAYKRLT